MGAAWLPLFVYRPLDKSHGDERKNRDKHLAVLWIICIFATENGGQLTTLLSGA